MYDISLDRYYNRTGLPSHKDYKEVLFRAGDSLQSAEVNELQTHLKRSFGDLTKRFVPNGGIVTGVEINTEITKDLTSGLYTVDVSSTEGVMFINGEFVRIDASLFQVLNQDIDAGASEFKIGAKIQYQEVTQEEDSTLLDPALETRNYGRAGAGRLKITGTIIEESTYEDSSDTEYFPLFSVENGEIVTPEVHEDEGFEQYRQEVTDIVAKYDRNSNGNYLLFGHEVSYIGITNPYDGTLGTNLGPFWFSVANGSSNVDGYNYEVDHSRYMQLAELIDFELKQNEPITFNGAGWYSVRHSPIRKVFRVTGPKVMEGLAVTHGSYSGAADELPSQYQPVISISKVYQGGTTFIQGVDYSLVDDSVNWLTGGNEPAANSTYYVDFKYQYTESEGGFTSDGNATNGDISQDKSKIYLQGFNSGDLVQYDYDFVLKRVDAIVINSNGELDYVKGTPSEDVPSCPDNDKDKTLKIAEVLLSADSDPVVTMDTNRTFKMSDIQLLLDGIKDNQYNVGRLALEIDMIRKQPGASFRGVFVDNFINDDYRDSGYENTALTIDGNLVMDIDWITLHLEPNVDVRDDQYTFSLGTIPNGTPILSQPHYTKTRKVNSYLFSHAPKAKIRISPSVYRWVDKTIYRNYFRTAQGSSRVSTRTKKVFKWVNWWELNKVGTSVSVSSSTTKESMGSTKSTSKKIVSQRTPSIIPNIPIKIKSNDGAFNSNETVDITMDGVSCGSLQANSVGTISGTITVPNNMMSGSKLIEVVGRDSDVQGETLFQAEPLSRIITTTVTKWWRWHTRRNWTITKTSARRPINRDPLAQTFSLGNDTVLDKIEVVFDVASETDVTCILTETTAGMPDKTKTLASKEISVNDLVPAGQRQAFVFDEKVLLTGMKEYAFIIVNSDPVAELQVAELGEKTIDTPNIWLSDPAYQTGVLFSSANNSAWTPHQKEDMRFWLYSCSFDTQEVFEYKTVQVNDATDLILNTNAKVYEGTSIEYKIELLDRTGTTTVPSEFKVTPYDQIPLVESYSGAIRVSASVTSNGLKSPVLDVDAQLAVGTSKKVSKYTSVGIDIDYHDASVEVRLDAYEPSGTSIKTYLQVVDPSTKVVSWDYIPRTNETTPLGDGWDELVFKYSLQDNGNPVIDVDQKLTRVMIVMETTNDFDRPVCGNLRFNTVRI